MLIIPKNYRNILGGVEQTEKAIKAVKDMFQVNLSAQLALLRVTAPMMVLSGQGLKIGRASCRERVCLYV